MHELICRQVTHPPDIDDGTAVAVWPNLMVRLSGDETIRWRGLADTSLSRYNRSAPEGNRYEFAWNLVEPAEILVTDTRLIYRANHLGTRPGLAAAFGAGAITQFRSAALRPDAYAGHIQFDWVANVAFGHTQLLGIAAAVILVTTLGHGDGPLRLSMTFSTRWGGTTVEAARMLAAALAGNVARHRLATGRDRLSDDDARALERQRDGAEPVILDPRTLRWDLPGATLVGARTPSLGELLTALDQAILRLPRPRAVGGVGAER
ncbi:hypothetical protein GCM10027610_053510 [Dactylosporangium cerinum]